MRIEFQARIVTYYHSSSGYQDYRHYTLMDLSGNIYIWVSQQVLDEEKIYDFKAQQEREQIMPNGLTWRKVTRCHISA